MDPLPDYFASQSLDGEAGALREYALTRWMSHDLRQAAVDFCRNLGLLPLYAETSPDGLTRYLFWQPAPGALLEVRCGRIRAQFEEFDRQNRARDRVLLSLHVNGKDVYSAVWISQEHRPVAVQVLRGFGLTAAERRGS